MATVYNKSNPYTGISNMGMFYKYPISSCDMNSLQGVILANVYRGLADRAGMDFQTAHIQFAEGEWETRTEATSLQVTSVSACLMNPNTKDIHFLGYAPNDTEANPLYVSYPVDKQDHTLYFCYRFMAYVFDEGTTVYEPRYLGELYSDKIKRFGLCKSDSITYDEVIETNDIYDTLMDTEVSVRYGAEWTLSWDAPPSGFSYSIPVASYIASVDRIYSDYFGTANNMENSYPAVVPAIVSTATDTITLAVDGALYTPLSEAPVSQFKMHLRSAMEFQAGGIKVKFGSSACQEYTLIMLLKDGSEARYSRNLFALRWEAGDYEVTVNETDKEVIWQNPAEVFYRTRKHYALKVSDTGAPRYAYASTPDLDTANAKTFKAEYSYDKNSKSITVTANKVYNLDGLDHCYDRETNSWKTCKPAGMIEAYPVSSSCPPGSYLCYGAQISRTNFDQLYKVIGTTYGSNGTDNFLLPNYADVFLRGSTKQIDETVKPSKLGEDKTTFTLDVENLPSHQHGMKHWHDFSGASGSAKGDITGSGTASSAGEHSHVFYAQNKSHGGSNQPGSGNTYTQYKDPGCKCQTEEEGSHTHSVSFTGSISNGKAYGISGSTDEALAYNAKDVKTQNKKNNTDETGSGISKTIPILPTCYSIRYFITLGQSLVIPDDTDTITVETSSPTVYVGGTTVNSATSATNNANS